MSNNGGGDVSATRLYLGNLPKTATKEDVKNHFASHSNTVKINEVKLMSGFGFIEFEDELDAREIVPGLSSSVISITHMAHSLWGERLIVQFAKGTRREPFAHHERPPPRPRRTPYKMTISGLPTETSWQDLKDFARQSGLDVVYSEVSRERDGRGYVEYETMNDLNSAVEKLDNREFKNQVVHCVAEPQDERTFRDRGRSRSPGGYRGGRGYPGQGDDHGYGRPPRRGYSPRRDDYRRRSPPPREPYDRGYFRSPPRGGGGGGARGPAEDYPSRRYYEDPYDARGPPPPRRAPYEDPYPNGGSGGGGHGRPPYGGPPSPRRRSPGRQPYEGGYERQPRY